MSGNGRHVLVVCVPDPGERTQNADCDEEVGDHAHYQDSVVVVFVVDEDERDAENEPDKARCCASRVNAAQMLQC